MSAPWSHVMSRWLRGIVLRWSRFRRCGFACFFRGPAFAPPRSAGPPTPRGAGGLAASAPPDGGARAARMMSPRGRPILRTHATWRRRRVNLCLRDKGGMRSVPQGVGGEPRRQARPRGSERRAPGRQEKQPRQGRRKRQRSGRTRGGTLPAPRQARAVRGERRASKQTGNDRPGADEDGPARLGADVALIAAGGRTWFQLLAMTQRPPPHGPRARRAPTGARPPARPARLT